MVFACSRNGLVLLVLQVHGGGEEEGTVEKSGFGNREGFASDSAVEEETLFRSWMGSLASVEPRTR